MNDFIEQMAEHYLLDQYAFSEHEIISTTIMGGECIIKFSYLQWNENRPGGAWYDTLEKTVTASLWELISYIGDIIDEKIERAKEEKE